MAFSYWEARTWLEDLDLLVVGAGIVGMSAALHTRQLHPEARIAVVDRSPFSDGGTTRNAGFACFGSPEELAADRASIGDAAAADLVRRRLEGLTLLRSLLGDDQIRYAPTGSYSLLRPGTPPPDLTDLNAWLAPVTGRPDTFFPTPPAPPPPGIAPHLAHGAVFSPLEGHLDTGRLVARFRSLLHTAGIPLLHGLSASSIRAHHDRPTLTLTPNSNSNSNSNPNSNSNSNSNSISPRNLLIATNAFAAQLLPDLDVRPVPNRVLVTAPIPGLDLRGTFHMDAGYVYFRELDGRVLIGGGRHFPEAAGDEAGDAVRARLLRELGEWVPAARGVGVDYDWTGLLGIGSDRTPIVTTVPHIATGVIVAVRMGGMGVAIGAGVGMEAAGLVRG
jgi:glycine/D-amino acid oxidase-like deaminating enzyme